MKKRFCQGQALLPVIIIIVIALTLGVGIFHLSISSLLISSYSQTGDSALMVTEGALEEGLMKLLRNPSYTGEIIDNDNLPGTDFTCTISISGQAPVIITVECVNSDNLVERILRAEVNYVAGKMVVSNISEI